MEKLNWRYYNHALLPTVAPHENVNEKIIKQGKLWKKKWKGVPLLIRWTTNFDCGEKTEWWYCIKDTSFDINLLKSERRYKINKGKKFFDVKEIDPLSLKKEIYEIQKKAYETYPLKYKPKVIRNKLYEEIEHWNKYKVYGAFDKKNNLCSYLLLFYNNKCINLLALKSNPEYEKLQVNAAIIAKVLEDINSELNNGFYICDGERNILHETNFQSYLEKYFGFRKAYCRLNIHYRSLVKLLVYILYPFRNFIKKFDYISIFNKINVILFMEEIKRSFK